MKKIFTITLGSLLALSNMASAGDIWGRNDTELRRLEMNLSQKKRELREQEIRAQQLDRNLQNARNIRRSERQNVDQAQLNVNNKQARVDRLEAEKQQLESQIQRDTQRKEQEIRSLQRKINQLETEIRNANGQINTLQSEVNDLAARRKPQRLAALPGEIAAAQSNLKKKEDRLKAVQERLADLRANCHSTECLIHINAHEREEKQLQQEIPGLKKIVKDKQAALQFLQNIENRYTQKSNQLKNLVAQTNQKKQDLAKSKRDLVQVQNSPIPGVDRLAEVKRKINSLLPELRQAQRDLQVAKQRLQTARERVEDLEAQSNQVASHINRLQSQIQNLEERIADLRSRPDVRRVVLVGSHLDYQLERELLNEDVLLVNTDQQIDIVRELMSAANTAVYILADTLGQELVQDHFSALNELIQASGMLFIIGDTSRISSDARLVEDLTGVSSTRVMLVNNIDGNNILSNIHLRQRERIEVYNLISQSTYGLDTVLEAESHYQVGLSKKISSRSYIDARVMSLGISLNSVSSNILGEIERSMCQSIGSSERNFREICQ